MKPLLVYTGLELLQLLQEARNYNRYLADLCERAAGNARQALDFGAGIGTFADLIRQRGFAVRCVEADAHLAEHLREKGFETITDLAELADGSVDYVYTLNVFEHIEDDRSVLRSLSSKLRAGGRLLIYVPAFEFLWTGLDDHVEHHRRYTRATLCALLASAGLQVEECRYADSVGYLGALLYKIFGNREGRLSSATIRAYDRFAMPCSIVLDKITDGILGKNVYAICRKPGDPS